MGSESSVIPVDHANSNNPPRRNGKHRCDDLVSTASASKRQHLVDDNCAARAAPRFGGGLYASSGGGGASAASQAMELFAIGPALNTNGKPRARRGSATDPQSVYARVSSATHVLSLVNKFDHSTNSLPILINSL